MARKNSWLQRGKFESLEPRQLLAGNVVVNVVGGNLSLEGDVDANKIMITSGTAAGTFVVTGLDGTTLGDSTDPVTVTNVRNIRINLGEGDDLVALVGANVGGNLSIRTGAGDDRVLVGTGAGAAELVGVLPADVSVNVRGHLNVSTNGGLDQAAVDNATVSWLSVDAGEDNDVVSLGSTEPLGTAAARLAVRHAAHVDLGAGNDQLSFDQVRTRGGIVARGGIGDDTIDASLTKAAAMIVFSDGGLDAISLADLDVRHLGVHTGEGNDTVEVRDSVFASLAVSLGDGNDTLTTGGLEAKVAVLNGGVGEDTYDEQSANVFMHSRIQGFEIPPNVNVNDLPDRRPLLRRLLGRLR